LLNTNESNGIFTVINRGRPGQNTAQLLENLEGYLNETEPDIVLVLTGGANFWNYWGYQVYKQRDKVVCFVNDQLYRLRVYKLVKLLCRNLRDKTQYDKPKKQPLPRNLEPEEGTLHQEKETDAPAAPGSPDMWKQNKVCRRYFKNRDYDKGLACFLKGIEIYPGFAENFKGIGWLYKEQKRKKEALPWFMKALELDPSNIDCYDGIAQVYAELGLYSEAVDFFRKEKARNPAANDFLLMFKIKKQERIGEEVIEWVQENIGRIISVCAKHNVKIILQNYPDEFRIDDVLRKVAKRYGIPFVNHNQVFTQISEKRASHEEYREEYFLPDGHPNAQGYGVMAMNVYNKLKGNGAPKRPDDL
jgi:tetratricopeptide (TPR) repeat protein